jgi:hypothetical protein
LVKKGHNIRDYGNTHQLIVIGNLEPLNAELIRNNVTQYDRLQMLRQAAIEWLKSLSKSTAIQDTYIDSPLVDKHKHIDIKNIDTDKQTPNLNKSNRNLKGSPNTPPKEDKEPPPDRELF